MAYDAAGNAVQGPEGGYRYDAAGRSREVSAGGVVYARARDGDGAAAARFVRQSSPQQETATYYLRSGALGGRVVAEFDARGARQKGYVWAGGELLAEQAGGRVAWRHEEPHGASMVEWDERLNFVSQAEFDPTGVDVGAENPFAGGGGDSGSEGERVSLIPEDPSGRCRHDGLPILCARVGRLLALDAAVFDAVTTVTIRRRSGKVESYSGDAGLPPGYGARFTG